ncbi:MAG: hypothetical protein EZS28_038183 [Streblomastix strix]|uniref:Uncharacterized protein n=1 Tax=Streblomastix strix TaxID=222440 RepID=A0A5J4U7V8_9EUKA|nr:MAG: hypothetical protein EZS28_038183 [Streblomastix strix]
MKISRIGDSEVELAEKIKMVPSDLFEKYGEFCVICGRLPAETESNDFLKFLEKFDIFGLKIRMDNAVDKQWSSFHHKKN